MLGGGSSGRAFKGAVSTRAHSPAGTADGEGWVGLGVGIQEAEEKQVCVTPRPPEVTRELGTV